MRILAALLFLFDLVAFCTPVSSMAAFHAAAGSKALFTKMVSYRVRKVTNAERNKMYSQ